MIIIKKQTKNQQTTDVGENVGGKNKKQTKKNTPALLVGF